MWPHGVVVLEPDSVPDGLLALHRSLATALQRLDIPIESRNFRPHITLARHAEGLTLPARTPRNFIQWQVQDYALMKSLQTSTGRYSVIQIYR